MLRPLLRPLLRPVVLTPALAILLGVGGRYRTQGRDYDGTNDYATRGAALTGMADGKAGIVSLWFRMDGGDGASVVLLANGTGVPGSSNFYVARTAANVLSVLGRNAAAATILSCASSTTYTAGAAWVHLLAAWDLAAGVSQMYVNDADVKSGAGTQTNDVINYTANANFAVGGGTGGAAKLNGCLSEVFMHTTYLDISVEANRRKFRNALGKPVRLGTNGALPLGVQPLIYMPSGDPADNRGTGGNFTVTGALDVASTSPSD